MTMPKAAVDKYRNSRIYQNKIWMSCQSLWVFSEPDPCDSQQMFTYLFSAGSSRTHRPHDLTALKSRECVRHVLSLDEAIQVLV